MLRLTGSTTVFGLTVSAFLSPPSVPRSPPATPASAGSTETGSATGSKGTSEDAGTSLAAGDGSLTDATIGGFLNRINRINC